jgi:hypothetical protein
MNSTDGLDVEREAFERFCVQLENQLLIKRHPVIRAAYEDYTTSWAWAAWQASAALRATPATAAEPVAQAHRKTALVLAQRAVDAVVEENFGYFPRNDRWADEVLSLRDALE